jgi:hypothetical protein
MISYLITSYSRGLGFFIIIILAKKPTSEIRVVFAFARNTSKALKEMIFGFPRRVIFV